MEVERERERERAFQGTSVLSVYFSDPLCLFCCIHGLDIGSTRSKMEDVQQHPYKSLQGQSCTVCSSGVGAGCEGPQTNCYKYLHVVLFAGSFEHMIT